MDSLLFFSWSETREITLSPQRRCISGRDDDTLPSFNHRWRQTPNQLQKGHDIALKIKLEYCWFNLHTVAEHAANGVVDYPPLARRNPRKFDLERQ
jgi:hypothetical protein